MISPGWEFPALERKQCAVLVAFCRVPTPDALLISQHIVSKGGRQTYYEWWRPREFWAGRIGQCELRARLPSVRVPNMRRIAWAWDGHAPPNRLMMRRADSPKVLDPRMPGLSVPCFITRLELDCGLP